MPASFSVLLGKSVKKIAALRGGGSALPGLFVEKINPSFIKNTLAQLPQGVVVVSGTNGKTTTTKMVVELLESQGLKVFTNRTGSNFTRGIAAALLSEIDIRGKLDTDIAVLELDEAHAIHFVRAVKPRYSLLLNVMRDQLDRFGEIDTTAKLLQTVAEATEETVVLNREDPRLLAVGSSIESNKVVYFGLSDNMRSEFPSDDDMRSDKLSNITDRPPAIATLDDLTEDSAVFDINGSKHETTLKLDGIYNTFNAAAAIATVSAILKDELNINSLVARLATVTPAFGRGEILTINNQPCELVLVKNPSGFRLGLKSFKPDDYSTMIAINDNYADGRDMSWLWDVDFDSLKHEGVSMVSGIRAYDMALRLQYEEVEIGEVIPSLKQALESFLQSDKPKRIYCSYTAMLALRRELGKITEVEAVK
ncbi:DUF1727 domain-containing protein [Candidatus Nomurabacteria bacterium]|nr:DUF1727 domain-containing protein [Candidatus Nomurabacteria bacterium]